MLSKWDIAQLELEDVRERLHIKARQRPPIVVTSALTKRGLERLVRVIDDVYDRYASRIGTGEFNRLLRDILATREAPLVRGRRLKIYYGAQVQARPPRFRLTVNDRSRVTRDYAYWLENQLREALGAAGRARDPGPGRALRSARARRRRRLVGHGVRGRARAGAGTRSSSPAATPQAVAELASGARTTATCRASASRTASSPCCSTWRARRPRPS